MRFVVDTVAAMVTGAVIVFAFPAPAAGASSDLVEHHAPATAVVTEAPARAAVI